MSTPRVCIHGGLRRQCETCDLADQLAAETARAARAEKELDEAREFLGRDLRQANDRVLTLELAHQAERARADREAAARLHAEQEREGMAHALVRERVARDEADAARQEAERMIANADAALLAAERAVWADGLTYGSDAVDHLAEEILRLRAELAAMRG